MIPLFSPFQRSVGNRNSLLRSITAEGINSPRSEGDAGGGVPDTRRGDTRSQHHRRRVSRGPHIHDTQLADSGEDGPNVCSAAQFITGAGIIVKKAMSIRTKDTGRAAAAINQSPSVGYMIGMPNRAEVSIIRNWRRCRTNADATGFELDGAAQAARHPLFVKILWCGDYFLNTSFQAEHYRFGIAPHYAAYENSLVSLMPRYS